MIRLNTTIERCTGLHDDGTPIMETYEVCSEYDDGDPEDEGDVFEAEQAHEREIEIAQYARDPRQHALARHDG